MGNKSSNEGQESIVAACVAMLEDDGIRGIVKRYEDAKQEFERQRGAGLNIFEVIGGARIHECSHSRIIWALLNYKDQEEEQPFLRLFLRYTEEVAGAQNSAVELAAAIRKGAFTDCRVTLEQGRVDVCILGQDKAIVIENKINDADDKTRQIPRYLERVGNEWGCVPVAAVYLTRDGLLGPAMDDWTAEDKDLVSPLLVRAAFYNNTKGDMVTGWLMQCCETVRPAADVDLLLRHYIEFLKKDGTFHMTSPAVEEFARRLLDGKSYGAARAIRDMLADLPIVLGRRIAEQCKGHNGPFEPKAPEDARGYYERAYRGCCMAWDQWKLEGDGLSHLALFVRFVDEQTPKFRVLFVELDYEREKALALVDHVIRCSKLDGKFDRVGDHRRGREREFPFSHDGEIKMVEFIKVIIAGFQKYVECHVRELDRKM